MEHAQRLLSTRKGAALAAATAALISLALILAYVNRYRSQAGSAGAPAVVLVAKSKIARGTPAEVIANKSLYETSRIRHDQLVVGALTSPAALNDKVLAHDVYPGQQLSTSDFTTATNDIASRLVDSELAIALTLDSQHSVHAAIAAGDRVNVYVGYAVETPSGSRPVVRLISQDVEVLAVSHGDASAQASVNFTLKARNARESATWAHAADHGTIWLALRPQASDKAQDHVSVDVDDVLFGKPPVVGVGGEK